MRALVLVLGLASLLLGTAAPSLVAGQSPPAPSRRLDIAFDLDGNVTLIAENVSLTEILAEWGRVGGAYMINAEKLAGAPVPMMRFEHRPEQEVIDSLLRSAAGYILGPRTTRTSGPSRFETVMILPTSSPIASGSYTAPPAATVPFRIPGAPEDEIPPVVPAVGVPVPNQPAPTPTPAPSSPVVTMPGVYVPIIPVTPVTGGRGRGGGGAY